MLLERRFHLSAAGASSSLVAFNWMDRLTSPSGAVSGRIPRRQLVVGGARCRRHVFARISTGMFHLRITIVHNVYWTLLFFSRQGQTQWYIRSGPIIGNYSNFGEVNREYFVLADCYTGELAVVRRLVAADPDHAMAQSALYQSIPPAQNPMGWNGLGGSGLSTTSTGTCARFFDGSGSGNNEQIRD